MHCVGYCVPCQPLLRAFSGWIQSPHPSDAGQEENTLTGFTDFRTENGFKPRPESGRDCLGCSKSARVPATRSDPLSSECSTHKTAKARFWTWRAGERTLKVSSCSLFARKRRERTAGSLMPSEFGVTHCQPRLFAEVKPPHKLSALESGSPIGVRAF